MLIIGAVCLLWWNEGRAVKDAIGLEEGKKAVISIDANEINENNKGKLVHISAEAVTTDE